MARRTLLATAQPAPARTIRTGLHLDGHALARLSSGGPGWLSVTAVERC